MNQDESMEDFPIVNHMLSPDLNVRRNLVYAVLKFGACLQNSCR